METTHSRNPSNVAHTSRIEDERVEDVEEEVRDELYCEMATNVVGVQYYKGWFNCPFQVIGQLTETSRSCGTG